MRSGNTRLSKYYPSRFYVIKIGMMKRPIIVFYFLFIVLCPLKAFCTTPTISGVSGAVANGQVLIISGSNMVNEDNTNWQQFFKTTPNPGDYEGVNPAADGWPRPGSSWCGGGTTCSYVQNVKLLGNQSVQFHSEGVYRESADYTASYGSYPTSNGCNGDIYVRLYARWSLNAYKWPNSGIKLILSGDSGDCLGVYNPAYQSYFEPSATEAGGLPYQFRSYWAGSNIAYHDIPSGRLENNRWYCAEVHLKSGVPPANGIFQAWIDGVQVRDATPQVYIPVSRVIYGLINHYGGEGNPYNIDNWIDGLVVSSSRVYPASIVEISNSSTYGSGTKKYQEPVYLTDSSIQIKVNLTGLGNGPYYLWVTNNRQERSQPYLFSSPPDSPTGLRIIK
jgi:hypothetical protein